MAKGENMILEITVNKVKSDITFFFARKIFANM